MPFFSAGDLIADRYYVERFLGEGGMGAVYAVADRMIGKHHALKTIHELDAESRYRLKQEFRAFKAVQHHNLVRLYELFVDSEHCFYTMELVQGLTLRRHVRRVQAVGELLDETGTRRLRAALPQLLGAIESLHLSGTIHRDIKPSNVMVADNGRLVLLDGGLVQPLSSTIEPPSAIGLAGTFEYTAPEQMMGSACAESDWYALGVLSYEMVAGVRPFQQRNHFKLLEAKQNQDYETLSQKVAPGLRALVISLLQVEPKARQGLPLASFRAPGGMTEPPPSPHAAMRLMIGREEEQDRLHAALAQVCGGRAAVVHVSGPSGMGKTTLVRQFLSQARHDDDVMIFMSRCRSEESVPFQALDACIDQLSRALRKLSPQEVNELVPEHGGALCKLFPVLERVDALADKPSFAIANNPLERRRQGVEGLCQLLRRLSMRQPLVLWIDDAQWGDRDSAQLLTALLAAAPRIRMLVLLTYRDIGEEKMALLHDVDNAPIDGVEVLRIGLGPLSDDECRQIAAWWLARPASDALLEMIVGRANGLPYTVERLAREADARGEGAIAALALGTDFAPLSGLSQQARRLLKIAASARSPLSPQTLLEASAALVEKTVAAQQAVTTPATVSLIEELLSANLLRGGVEGGREYIEPYHDQLRDAVLATLGADERRRIHRTLAEAIEGREGQRAMMLVHHWDAASAPERAAHYARQAGVEAESALAFAQAVGFYQIALRRLGEPTQRAELLRSLGRAYAYDGRGRAAAQSYEEAARTLAEVRPDAPEVIALKRMAGEQYLRSGHADDGTRLLLAALRAVDLLPSDDWPRLIATMLGGRLRLLRLGSKPAAAGAKVDSKHWQRLETARSATIGFAWVNNLWSSYYQILHARLAFEMGDPYQIGVALASESCYLPMVGVEWMARLGTRRAEAALRHCHRHDVPELRAFTLTCLGSAAFLRGAWRQAIDNCAAAVTVIRTQCNGAEWELTNCHLFGQWSRYFTAQVPNLTEVRIRETKDACERDDLLAQHYLAVGLPNISWLVDDEVEAARDEGEQAVEHWRLQRAAPLHYLNALGQVQVDLYEGRAGRAAARLDALAPWRSTSLLIANQVLRALYHYLSGCVALAQPAGSDCVAARRYVWRLRRERALWCRALAGALEAAMLAHTASRRRAESALWAAERQLTECDMHLHAMAVRFHLDGAARRTQQAPMDATAAPASSPRKWSISDAHAPERVARCLLPLPPSW